MLWNIEGKRRVQKRMRRLHSFKDSMDMNLSNLWDSEGQGSLACCNPCSCEELDRLSDWTSCSILHNSENWSQGNGNKTTLELKINWTLNNWDEADPINFTTIGADCCLACHSHHHFGLCIPVTLPPCGQKRGAGFRAWVYLLPKLLLNEVTFPFLTTLSSWASAFKGWVAGPEFSSSYSGQKTERFHFHGAHTVAGKRNSIKQIHLTRAIFKMPKISP